MADIYIEPRKRWAVRLWKKFVAEGAALEYEAVKGRHLFCTPGKTKPWYTIRILHESGHPSFRATFDGDTETDRDLMAIMDGCMAAGDITPLVDWLKDSETAANQKFRDLVRWVSGEINWL